MVTKEKEREPDVVEALPIETTVELVVSDSFYEDVKRELKIDPEEGKRQVLEFEDELTRPIAALKEATSVMLKPPSVANRGPLPKPKEVSE